MYLRDEHALIPAGCKERERKIGVRRSRAMQSFFAALTLEHVPVGHVRDGEEVRRNLVPPLAQVDFDRRRGVNRVPLVRVHRHTEEARIGLQNLDDISQISNIDRIRSLTKLLDLLLGKYHQLYNTSRSPSRRSSTYVNHLGLVPRLQVPQHRGLVQVGQVGHVLALLKLGRVHLGDLLALEGLFLKAVKKR